MNIGHGSLGWTLAHGSATLLTELIDGQRTSIDASPFSFSA
ncbi:hypothetical protein CAter10_0537 [Collimonas arenae]|nr:hypothetical protein CAter10_0537 [Collimonas arenae]